MKLGDILGTISPAYGLLTGDGLGGAARNLSPLYLLLSQLGHHHSQQQPQNLGQLMQQGQLQFPQGIGQPGPYPGY